MRIVIGGAELTDGLIELIEELQVNRELFDEYMNTLKKLNRSTFADDTLDQAEMLSRICTLQALEELLRAIACPPGVDDPENDEPVVEL